MATRALLTAAAMVVVVLLQQHRRLADAGGEAGATDDLRYHHRRRFHHHRDARQAVPAPPVQPVQPVRPHPPPPPPPPRQLCNSTFGPEEALTVGGDVCVPVPAPVAPAPPPRGRCPPCTCPAPRQLPRPFPGWPVPRPLPVPGRGSNAGAGSGSGGDAGFDCVAPLAPMMTCGEFVTVNGTETPTPASQCCSGLAAFLRSSTGRGDHLLQCLCPFILGDVNRVLPKPIDPVRMMYLPIACGVVLPPQLLPVCFAGQPHP